MLLEGYSNAADALQDFIKAWGSIEFNARDYYVQGDSAFDDARTEREEISRKIRELRTYIDNHLRHIHDA